MLPKNEQWDYLPYRPEFCRTAKEKRAQGPLQTVEKVVFRKKLHKTEEMRMPDGIGHGVSKKNLAAYDAFP